MFPFILVPLVMVAVGVIAAAELKSDRERNAMWRRWTLARDWQYIPAWKSMVGAYRGGPFHRGGRQRADRGFTGTFDGLPVFGFRYRYTISTGKSSHTYVHRICGIPFPGAKFPALRIVRESGVIFSRDLQFENVQFNDRWHVKCPSPRFAHDVLHPLTMEYLMGPLPRFKELWFSGDSLLVSVPHDPAPEVVDAQLRMLTDFADLLRPHVLKEVGTLHREVDDSGPGVSVAEQEHRMMLMAQQEHHLPRRH